jgi:hypothetical protein
MSDDNSSIYRRIISNTSIFFGVFLLLNDLISVYAIPLIRLVIITLLLIVSILIIIANAINLEFSFSKVLGQSLIAPLFSYIGITIGMAYILSLFMGQMAKGVEVTTQSISLGDPTTTLIAMILINAAVFMLYFKVVKKLIADFKTYFKAIADNMISAVAGAFQKVAKSFTALYPSISAIYFVISAVKLVPLAYPKNIKNKEKSVAISEFELFVPVKTRNPLYIPKANSLLNLIFFVSLGNQ